MERKARNSAYMKQANRQRILSIIRKKPLSRAELARETGLTRAAISLIIEELIKDGLVTESGVGEAEFGRKPVYLAINPDRFYVVGLNIARDRCVCGIVNLKGEHVLSEEVHIENVYNSEEAIIVIEKAISDIIKRTEIDPGKFLGIGISAPGPIDSINGTILNPPNFPMWHNVNIVREIKKRFPYDVYLENNANALALAERDYGAGIGLKYFMLLVVDTGIGAGIITDSRLYRGIGGFGSEVGHTSIDFNGLKCDCGNKGCLETYASIPSLIRNMKLREYGINSWREIADRAETGDKFCQEVIDREALYLSAAIINVINILELEAVILAGYINYRPGLLLRRLRENIENSVINRNARSVNILNSSIREHAEIISAASIVMDKYFNFSF